MIDPMANIGGAQPMSQPNAAGFDPHSASGGDEVFDMNAQQQNLQQMESIRSFMGIISGCCAGILGLTNVTGIAFFVAMHLVISACLYVQMSGNLGKYFKGIGTFGFWLDGLQNCFMSFMLFWTLFYGLVYLF